MHVERSWLWVVLAVTCVPSTAVALRIALRRGFYATHARWLDAPRAFVATVLDGALTGLGVGMALTFAVVLLGVVLALVGV